MGDKVAVKAESVKNTEENIIDFLEKLIDLYMVANPYYIYGFRFVTKDGVLKVFEFMNCKTEDEIMLLQLFLPGQCFNSDNVREQIIGELENRYEKAGWKTNPWDGHDDYDDYYLEFGTK